MGKTPERLPVVGEHEPKSSRNHGIA